MTTALSILNLSDRRRHWLAPDERLKGTAIDSADHVPAEGEVPEQDFLILYVVGHGAVNGLVDHLGHVIHEKKVADAIIRRRSGRPTVIIWDVCFAESMLQIGGTNIWPSNFIHVFSCRGFERTWHSGRRTYPARTVFSRVLCEAVTKLAARPNGQFTWNALQGELQRVFGCMQRPSIVSPPESKWMPRDFELAKWLGGGGSAGPKGHPVYAGAGAH